MHFLDTSAILEILYGSKRGLSIKDIIADKPICTSPFSIYELNLGLKDREVKALNTFFKDIAIVDFDKHAAARSAEIEKYLKKKGCPINKVDIFIAGICLTNNLALVTCDHDFEKVKGLKLHVC